LKRINVFKFPLKQDMLSIILRFTDLNNKVNKVKIRQLSVA